METDTTNYLNLSLCLGGLLFAHLILILGSNKIDSNETKPKPKAKKKKSK